MIVLIDAPVVNIEQRFGGNELDGERSKNTLIHCADSHRCPDVIHPRMRAVRDHRTIGVEPVLVDLRRCTPIPGKRFQPPFDRRDRRGRGEGSDGFRCYSDVCGRSSPRRTPQVFETELRVRGVEDEAAQCGFVNGHLCVPIVEILNECANWRMSEIEDLA